MCYRHVGAVLHLCRLGLPTAPGIAFSGKSVARIEKAIHTAIVQNLKDQEELMQMMKVTNMNEYW